MLTLASERSSGPFGREPRHLRDNRRKDPNWEAEHLHDFVLFASIPDCGPTRHGALSCEMSRLLTTRIGAIRSWKLKYAESAASDIARVCPVL